MTIANHVSVLLPVALALAGACSCARSGDSLRRAEEADTGACVPRTSSGGRASGNADALTRLLSANAVCPANVLDLRGRLTAAGATFETAFVDNRGYHDPQEGSFSFFEAVTGTISGVEVKPGDFFFGHFTEGDGSTLRLAQDPRAGSLMVELIAWDPAKGAYNFFELIGDGTTGRWFYRGDSFDILRDDANLHVQADPSHPVFGRTLRCSGCHVGGGPIMKELDRPHNDWWQSSRPLPTAPLEPDAHVASLVDGVVSADVLSERVHQGRARLEASPAFRAVAKGRTMREVLRPLFCPEELNLASDTDPDDVETPVQVPGEFFVDARLAASPALTMPRDAYRTALAEARSVFAESGRPDADHAWLAPVKATADVEAVGALVREGTIDDEFVADVLAIDMQNPALSAARCGLLRLVPSSADGWRSGFESALAASSDPFARELHSNLTDGARTAVTHRKRAADLLAACSARLANADATASAPYVALLAMRRAEVFANEISKNPRGQILEPGFRLVFPQVASTPAPGSLRLSDTCEVLPAAQ